MEKDCVSVSKDNLRRYVHVQTQYEANGSTMRGSTVCVSVQGVGTWPWPCFLSWLTLLFGSPTYLVKLSI